MDGRRGFLLLALLAVPAFAGCLGTGDDADDLDRDTDAALVPVQERYLLPYNTTGAYSRTLEPGPYGILDGIGFDVPMDLPVTEGGDALTGTVTVSLGLFLPDIPGCDWQAESLDASCQVPVVADVGPYYTGTRGLDGIADGPLSEGDTPVTEPAHRLGGFLIENFVPHGYAVAQVSVLGTGDSTHCMDLMGRAEQAGVNAAVTWLGEQAWSNGNVGLIGRSYDGSTPWEAASTPNPHLKTIVPISGLIGQHDLMWRNGSAEFRGPGLLYALYAAMTIDGEVGDAQQVLCPDYLTGGPEGVAAYTTGDTFFSAANPYWEERRFLDAALASYTGSIYLIHGLQDWNVDNHMAFPTYHILQDHGFEVKGLFGQWDHAYPDRPSDHSDLPSGKGAEAYPKTVRYDWAQDLLEWFDHYLKGTGPAPDLHVEVQDNMGAWRIEASYPPRDATVVSLPLSDATPLHTGPDVIAGTDTLLGVGDPGGVGSILQYVFPPLDDRNDTRIAGNVHLPLSVTPLGSGGQVFAELSDAETGLRLGHAIMDLRYAAGGRDMRPVVPGVAITAQMEFFAMDVVLPAGHGLHLKLASTGEDYLPASTSSPVLVDTTASTLEVPTVVRGEDVFFTPPTVQE